MAADRWLWTNWRTALALWISVDTWKAEDAPGECYAGSLEAHFQENIWHAPCEFLQCDVLEKHPPSHCYEVVYHLKYAADRVCAFVKCPLPSAESDANAIRDWAMSSRLPAAASLVEI